MNERKKTFNYTVNVSLNEDGRYEWMVCDDCYIIHKRGSAISRVDARGIASATAIRLQDEHNTEQGAKAWALNL